VNRQIKIVSFLLLLPVSLLISDMKSVKYNQIKSDCDSDVCLPIKIIKKNLLYM